MKHYDLRVIEDCLVYSYEVELPNYPKEEPQTAEKVRPSCGESKHKTRVDAFKHFLFRLFVIALMPFALIIDAFVAVFRFAGQLVMAAFHLRAKYIPVLGTLSCFIFATVLLNYL